MGKKEDQEDDSPHLIKELIKIINQQEHIKQLEVITKSFESSISQSQMNIILSSLFFDHIFILLE